MPHLKIFNNNNIKAFDSPPEFNGEERKRFFYLPTWASALVEDFRTPTNKIGFILQFGYFKASNRFFVARNFYQSDIEFVVRRLNVLPNTINLSQYTRTTFERHQKLILENTGIQKFDQMVKGLLVNEARNLSLKQTKPRLMFMSLVDFLRKKKIETPGYYTFAEIITDAIRNFEKVLIDSIENSLSIKEKQLLDSLLELRDEYLDGDKQDSKIKRYKITLLKKSNQSTKPSKIKENIQDLKCLGSLFRKIEPVINNLNLSSESIQYYAQIVIKSRVFQINRREKRRYLLLIAFVTYQYYQLNDILIEVLVQSVQNKFNSIEREHKEDFYNQRKERQQVLNTFSQKVTDHLSSIKDAKKILHNQTLSSDEKVDNLMVLFSEEFDKTSTVLESQLSQIAQESKRITKNANYYDLLKANSIKLQNRISGLFPQRYPMFCRIICKYLLNNIYTPLLDSHFKLSFMPLILGDGFQRNLVAFHLRNHTLPAD